MHLTMGNTSAGVVLARVHEAILIDISSTFNRMASAWELHYRTNRESQVRRDFHVSQRKMGKVSECFRPKGCLVPDGRQLRPPALRRGTIPKVAPLTITVGNCTVYSWPLSRRTHAKRSRQTHIRNFESTIPRPGPQSESHWRRMGAVRHLLSHERIVSVSATE